MAAEVPVTDPSDTARIEKQRHFIRAMSRSIEGHPLEQPERALLEQVFAALMRGEDVSGLTGVRRPRAQRSTDPIHVALHYLCLTRLMDTPAEAAWDTIGEAWGLNRLEVQRLIAENRGPALAALPRFADAPARLLRICERQARGGRPVCHRPAGAASTPNPDDALIRMLTQLVQRAAAEEATAP